MKKMMVSGGRVMKVRIFVRLSWGWRKQPNKFESGLSAVEISISEGSKTFDPDVLQIVEEAG